MFKSLAPVFRSASKCQNTYQGGDTGHFTYVDVLCFEPILYFDPGIKFPNTTEMPKYFAAFGEEFGNDIIFKLLKMIRQTCT
jgi:hypothetical protein